MRQAKDRFSKWLISHFGNMILQLAGIGDFTRWQAVQPETVAPRRLPDGLIEVTFPEDPLPVPFLIEVETYADNSADPQVFEDILLITLDRGEIPDVVALILQPKGNIIVTGEQERRSRKGTAVLAANWHVIELWTLNAEALLALNEVGVVPWIPLTHFASEPEPLLRQCRERIDLHPNRAERAALVVITHLFVSMAFREPALRDIFGEDEWYH